MGFSVSLLSLQDSCAHTWQRKCVSAGDHGQKEDTPGDWSATKLLPKQLVQKL